MHAALAEPDGPEFTPEPFTHEDAEKLYQEMLGQADITFELLRRKQPVLTGEAAADAQQLLRIEHNVTERFSALRNQPIQALRIRYHGDYHLGQVLYTGSDFMIIDFEGEPARPLAHRRMKTLAMRDVAGMIRSFQYAAYSALPPSSPTESADYWTVWASAAYLNGYFSEAADQPFVPRDTDERRILFDAFLLQKALYEVAYELNNRPDWVKIPLRGILRLMS
jgi:maltose alpha-D-glucosyltransferase/alpha-amylase